MRGARFPRREDEPMTDPVKVTMTAEPEPHGYGQHMITVERASDRRRGVQRMTLTGLELMQVECLIANYRASGQAAHAAFPDHSGRPAVIQEEHGRYGVIS
jgi:hypothetical protein